MGTVASMTMDDDNAVTNHWVDAQSFEDNPGGGNASLSSAAANNYRTGSTITAMDRSSHHHHYDVSSANSTTDGNPHLYGVSSANSTTGSVHPPSTSATLTYPHDFLDLRTGQGPKDHDEAAKLWQYRKARPASGTVDMDQPDGALMMREVKAMRERLKNHIETAFFDGARGMAVNWNLKMPGMNRFPVTKKDFNNAIGALQRVKGSQENERIVYMVCHHFHRQRTWLTNAVDAWCRDENIKIEYPTLPKVVDGVRKRQSKGSRGGFAACARRAKTDVVKQLMRNMLNQAGWCIATKDNSEQASRNIYERIYIGISQTGDSHACYVVTKDENSDKKPAAKNKDAASATMVATAPNALDVDNMVSEYAKRVESQLGVSAEKLQEIWNQCHPTSDVKGLHIDTGNKTPGDLSDLTVEENTHRPAGLASNSNKATDSDYAHSFTAGSTTLHAVSVSAAPPAAAQPRQQPVSSIAATSTAVATWPHLASTVGAPV